MDMLKDAFFRGHIKIALKKFQIPHKKDFEFLGFFEAFLKQQKLRIKIL